MKLFYRESGKGKPLIILHGLYGSSDNWVSIAKELEKYFRVINVDQRNHGQSPHSPDHTYELIANDLLELLNDLNIEKAIFLGHSMGGKAVMQFSIKHPHRVNSQIVVDISPWSHLVGNEQSAQIVSEHKKIIEGLKAIPIDSITSRKEADEILARFIKGEIVRQFLLKNLKREQDGSFTWKLNLSSISNNLTNMMIGIVPENTNDINSIRTLFIKGDLSNYIPTENDERLKDIFPNSSIININGAGHWVHAEKPKEFINAISTFLKY